MSLFLYFPVWAIKMTSCFVHHRFQAKGARTYNDDIQGTAAVTVAGILGSLRVTKGKLSEQTVLFFGAGQANIGAAELLVKALVEDGVDEPIARSNVFLFDSKGLVVDGRPAEFAISDDKAPFAAKPRPAPRAGMSLAKTAEAGRGAVPLRRCECCDRVWETRRNPTEAPGEKL